MFFYNSLLIYFSRLGTPHAKKALVISLSMVTLAYLTSTLTLVAFITQIFNETGSILSEKESAILMSITQLSANLIILNIVERFGRKVCISSDKVEHIPFY